MTILTKFVPYLRLIRAFHPANFRQTTGWRCMHCNIFYALATTFMACSMTIATLLMAWNLLESGGDTKKLLVSLPMVLSMAQVCLTLTAMVWENGTIAAVIEVIRKVVGDRSNESAQSRQIYEQAERKHSVFAAILEKTLIVGLSAVLLIAPILPISYALFGYPAPDRWTLPLQIHSLMCQTTYTGFFVDWLIETTAVSAGFITISASMSIYFGMFCYINGMTKDMRSRLSLPEVLGSHGLRDQADIYMREVKFHIEIIRAANALYTMMTTIIFIVTMDCSILIACNLYAVELTDSIDLETLAALIDVTNTVFMTFSYFYLSEWITADLSEIGDHFFGTPWYRLPATRQRLVMLPIERAQRVFRLKGLGIFDCSLAVFSAIIRTATSYFLMMRKFQ